MDFVARVVVTPKPVVNDPQGITVRRGLRSLGFQEVGAVRMGKYIELRLQAPDQQTARTRVEAMCDRLLANHVIEDHRFDLEEGEPAARPAGLPRREEEA